MELSAILECLRYAGSMCSKGDTLTINSDSAYCVNAFLQGWIPKWIAKKWNTSTGKPVENQDLWKAVVGFHEDLINKGVEVIFVKVKGHSKVHWNEFCDKRANEVRMAANKGAEGTMLEDRVEEQDMDIQSTETVMAPVASPTPFKPHASTQASVEFNQLISEPYVALLKSLPADSKVASWRRTGTKLCLISKRCALIIPMNAPAADQVFEVSPDIKQFTNPPEDPISLLFTDESIYVDVSQAFIGAPPVTDLMYMSCWDGAIRISKPNGDVTFTQMSERAPETLIGGLEDKAFDILRTAVASGGKVYLASTTKGLWVLQIRYPNEAVGCLVLKAVAGQILLRCEDGDLMISRISSYSKFEVKQVKKTASPKAVMVPKTDPPQPPVSNIPPTAPAVVVNPPVDSPKEPAQKPAAAVVETHVEPAVSCTEPSVSVQAEAPKGSTEVSVSPSEEKPREITDYSIMIEALKRPVSVAVENIGQVMSELRLLRDLQMEVTRRTANLGIEITKILGGSSSDKRRADEYEAKYKALVTGLGALIR